MGLAYISHKIYRVSGSWDTRRRDQMIEILDIREATDEEMKQFSQETEKETQIPQWQESMLRVFLANH